MLLNQWSISSEQELCEIAKSTAQELLVKSYDNCITLGLIGDLGAGKTTFARYFVKAILPDAYVNSPSFVLMNEYSTNIKDTNIEHWDIYRLKYSIPDELICTPDANTIRIIEWIDNDSERQISVDYLIKIDLSDESETRKISLIALESQG